MIEQQKLNNRFKDKHKTEFEDNWIKKPFKYSSWALMYKVTDDEHVIDIGCGTNPFKGKIKNLTGIDPVKVTTNNMPGADYVTPLEDFKTEKKFDVAFCLGSIQFGDEEYIAKQIAKLNSLLKTKARVYWRHRLNGIATYPEDPNEKYDPDYFIWTKQKMIEYANQYGFTCICKEDPNLVSKDRRLYCEWYRDE